MARTAKNAASTPAENKADVEAIEKNDVVNTPAENKAEKKAKDFKDDDEVEIICLELAGKSAIGMDPKNPIKFDENGKGKTTGKEARRLLTIPGYTLA